MQAQFVLCAEELMELRVSINQLKFINSQTVLVFNKMRNKRGHEYEQMEGRPNP